jgi:hypothetical protein
MIQKIFTVQEIASKIIAQKELKFYISSKTNKPDYPYERSLGSKLHEWFKNVMKIKSSQKLPGNSRNIPGYTKATVESALTTYRKLFFKFLDTPFNQINLEKYRNEFLAIKFNQNKANQEDSYDSTKNVHYDNKEEKEPDPMELASDECLKRDDVSYPN